MNTRSADKEFVPIETELGGENITVSKSSKLKSARQDFASTSRELIVHASDDEEFLDSSDSVQEHTVPRSESVHNSERNKLLVELRKCEEQEELLKLRSRLAAAKSRVAVLSSNTNNNNCVDVTDAGVARNVSESQPNQLGYDKVTLKDLQKGKPKPETDAKLSRALNYMWPSESSEEDESGVVPFNKGKKIHTKSRSGMEAKATDRVKNEVLWPQCFLQYEYVPRELKYKDLTTQLLVAGELEILISGLLSQREISARMSFLKLLMYYSNDKTPFPAIRDWYAAFLRAVEYDRAKWGDDPLIYGDPILRKARWSFEPKVGSANNGGQAGDVLFCLNYQFNKCALGSPHMAEIRGKEKEVLHICAKCWKRDRKRLVHPDSSAACPHNQ